MIYSVPSSHVSMTQECYCVCEEQSVRWAVSSYGFRLTEPEKANQKGHCISKAEGTQIHSWITASEINWGGCTRDLSKNIT